MPDREGRTGAVVVVSGRCPPLSESNLFLSLPLSSLSSTSSASSLPTSSPVQPPCGVRPPVIDGTSTGLPVQRTPAPRRSSSTRPSLYVFSCPPSRLPGRSSSPSVAYPLSSSLFLSLSSYSPCCGRSSASLTPLSCSSPLYLPSIWLNPL